MKAQLSLVTALGQSLSITEFNDIGSRNVVDCGASKEACRRSARIYSASAGGLFCGVRRFFL